MDKLLHKRQELGNAIKKLGQLGLASGFAEITKVEVPVLGKEGGNLGQFPLVDAFMVSKTQTTDILLVA